MICSASTLDSNIDLYMIKVFVERIINAFALVNKGIDIIYRSISTLTSTLSLLRCNLKTCIQHINFNINMRIICDRQLYAWREFSCCSFISLICGRDTLQILLKSLHCLGFVFVLLRFASHSCLSMIFCTIFYDLVSESRLQITTSLFIAHFVVSSIQFHEKET